MNFDTNSDAKQSRILLPHHAKMLEDSAISSEVIEARGYRSVTRKVELSGLGFTSMQNQVPALLIPIYGAAGEVELYQSRRDEPRRRNGKAVKYEFPAGAKMCIDFRPSAFSSIGVCADVQLRQVNSHES